MRRLRYGLVALPALGCSTAASRMSLDAMNRRAGLAAALANISAPIPPRTPSSPRTSRLGNDPHQHQELCWARAQLIQNDTRYLGSFGEERDDVV